MTDLYYFLSIILIWLELKYIVDPVKETLKFKYFTSLAKKVKDEGYDRNTLKYHRYIKLLKPKIWVVLSVFWLYAGLFSAQWFSFLLYLLFLKLIQTPIQYHLKFGASYIIFTWVVSVIGLLFCLFIVFNHYYFRIDVIDYFNSIKLK